eukprot:scaffold14936_cov89-Isochrysis_galbana.AAC.4
MQVSNTFDNALYPVMFVDYLQWFPILRISGLLRWSISVLMLAVVTGLNLVGVDVVAQVSEKKSRRERDSKGGC